MTPVRFEEGGVSVILTATELKARTPVEILAFEEDFDGPTVTVRLVSGQEVTLYAGDTLNVDTTLQLERLR